MTDTITLTVTVSVPIVAQLLVSAGSLVSVLLAGRRDADGRPRHQVAPWLLLIAAHGTFLAYVLATGQPGFLPLNVGMILAGLYNLNVGMIIAGLYNLWVARRATGPPTDGETNDKIYDV